MTADYKKFRKVPPYMTKTGIQIGLLHQEPFESRIDKDAYRLQEALLKKRYKGEYKEPIHYGDLAVGVVSVILFIILIVMEVYHVL
jgi:hypothetical protein